MYFLFKKLWTVPKHAWHNMHVSRRNVTKNSLPHIFFYSITPLFKKPTISIEDILKIVHYCCTFYFEIDYRFYWTIRYLVDVTKHYSHKNRIFTYNTYSCYSICLTQLANSLLRSCEIYTHFSPETRNMLIHVLHHEILWIDWLGYYRCYVSRLLLCLCRDTRKVMRDITYVTYKV